MPFALTGIVLGALVGALLAYRRKGKLLDILQYAAAFGILCGMAGLILAIAIYRLYS